MNDVKQTRIFTGPVSSGTRQVASRSVAQRRMAGKQAANRRTTGQRIARARRRSKPSFVQPRRIRKLSLALAAIAIALVAAFAVPTLVSRLAGRGVDLQAQEDHADSTPRAEWKRGSVPFLYQIDRRWADEPYAGGTVRENGCGPTALSMVYVALTGRTDLDPAAMAAFSERNGYVTDGMTAWTLMSDGAAQLGLSSQELPASTNAVMDALTAGQPVICSVRPGDFTSTGHFIVLTGIDENGQLIVRDPNSSARSNVHWDIDRVLSQCANLWAFAVA